MSGVLHIVASPIGNLDDVTLRALQVLRDADLVAVEDTRHSAKLMGRHGIKTRMMALHEHNEEQVAPGLVARIEGGENIALLSDAGTPLLSDPGYRLVRLAADKGVEIVAIPGPSAVIAALSISALPTDRFTFEGFLPARQSQRIGRLRKLVAEHRTMVFFESAHRILDLFGDLETVFGASRCAVICREMTKKFETVLRGTVGQLRERTETEADQRKGEFVVLVAGAAPGEDKDLVAAVEAGRVLLDYLPVSQAARAASRLHGVSRRAVYTELSR